MILDYKDMGVINGISITSQSLTAVEQFKRVNVCKINYPSIISQRKQLKRARPPLGYFPPPLKTHIPNNRNYYKEQRLLSQKDISNSCIRAVLES